LGSTPHRFDTATALSSKKQERRTGVVAVARDCTMMCGACGAMCAMVHGIARGRGNSLGKAVQKGTKKGGARQTTPRRDQDKTETRPRRDSGPRLCHIRKHAILDRKQKALRRSLRHGKTAIGRHRVPLIRLNALPGSGLAILASGVQLTRQRRPLAARPFGTLEYRAQIVSFKGPAPKSAKPTKC
jgi:hypothetical protein